MLCSRHTVFGNVRDVDASGETDEKEEEMNGTNERRKKINVKNVINDK